MKSYGIGQQQEINNKVDIHIENIRLKGFSIEENFLKTKICDDLSNSVEIVYRNQEESFQKNNLAEINELNMARMPFLEDTCFYDLFTNNFIVEVVEKTIGKAFHLHLQNAIINRPQIEHHQTAWHRDLPYQNWVISKPLALNAFYCLTEFTNANGATFILPYSHRSESFPSTNFVRHNELQVEAPKGSIIFFDSMLYHRAGINSSQNIRYGINNMFTVPIIKQQIDIAQHFANQQLDEKTSQILGVDYLTPTSIADFRQKRLNKKLNQK